MPDHALGRVISHVPIPQPSLAASGVVRSLNMHQFPCEHSKQPFVPHVITVLLGFAKLELAWEATFLEDPGQKGSPEPFPPLPSQVLKPRSIQIKLYT